MFISRLVNQFISEPDVYTQWLDNWADTARGIQAKEAERWAEMLRLREDALKKKTEEAKKQEAEKLVSVVHTCAFKYYKTHTHCSCLCSQQIQSWTNTQHRRANPGRQRVFAPWRFTKLSSPTTANLHASFTSDAL